MNFSQWLAGNRDALNLWIGAICTLGLYSVLYKENKIFRLFEHIFLGLATGYLLVTTWNETLLTKWWTPMVEDGQWWWVFALCIGALYYCIYSKKYNWMARLVIGFFLGVGAGQFFQAFVNDTWPQVYTSFKPLLPHGPIPAVAGPGGHPAIKAVTGVDAINNWIFMFILVCVMSYFFFSFEHKHPVMKGSAKWGRWLMMFAFGAIFGQTIMGRLSLLIDRMDFMMNDFGPQLGGAQNGPKVVFVILMVLTALVLYLTLRKNPKGEGTTTDSMGDGPVE